MLVLPTGRAKWDNHSPGTTTDCIIKDGKMVGNIKNAQKKLKFVCIKRGLTIGNLRFMINANGSLVVPRKRSIEFGSIPQ